MPLPSYDPTWPAIAQNDDWSCAPTSIRWTLWAYGRQPSEAWIEETMIAEGVANPDAGCTDASGAGLAAFVNRHYGTDGYSATNDPDVSFDELALEAASEKHPLAIGGRGWYHWSGLRGYDASNDLLMLANPAPGWHGVVQAMSRAQFGEQGPFSVVRVTHPQAESGVAPPGPPALLRGIDVASHQGQVAWPQVASSGVRFGWTKATGGTWYTNPTFAQNWTGIASAGLVRGAYHYAFETSGQPFPGAGPEAEAQYFADAIAAAGGLKTGDLLALDLEDGNGPLGEWCLRFLERVEALTGIRPFVYTGAWFADPHGLANTPALASYPLWQAAYQVTPPAPVAPWSEITIWQHSAEGRVPGVVGPVDLNRFEGSRDDLLAYGLPGAAPTPDNPYVVGPGIRDAMTAAGDVPASDEVYLKSQYGDAWSEAIGAPSGARYLWLPSVGRVFRYGPSA